MGYWGSRKNRVMGLFFQFTFFFHLLLLFFGDYFGRLVSSAAG